MRAELLRLHNLDRWGGHLPLRVNTPMRRALRAAGYIECRRPHATASSGAWRWYMTPAGRETLVNVPGSGISRHG